MADEAADSDKTPASENPASVRGVDTATHPGEKNPLNSGSNPASQESNSDTETITQTSHSSDKVEPVRTAAGHRGGNPDDPESHSRTLRNLKPTNIDPTSDVPDECHPEQTHPKTAVPTPEQSPNLDTGNILYPEVVIRSPENPSQVPARNPERVPSLLHRPRNRATSRSDLNLTGGSGESSDHGTVRPNRGTRGNYGSFRSSINDDQNQTSGSETAAIDIPTDAFHDESAPLLRRTTSRLSGASYSTVPDDSSLDPDELRKELWPVFASPRVRWTRWRQASKLVIFQNVKTVILLVLVFLYAKEEYKHIQFLNHSLEAFRQLYLSGWSTKGDGEPYALYSKPLFFKHVNQILKQYELTPQLPIGPYDFRYWRGKQNQPKIWITYYPDLILTPYKYTYDYDWKPKTVPYTVEKVNKTDPKSGKSKLVYDIEQFLADRGHIFWFNQTSRVELELNMTTIYIGKFSELTHKQPPFICYNFKVLVTYENAADDGQLMVDLSISETPTSCCDKSQSIEPSDANGLERPQNIMCIIVFFLCFVSAVLLVIKTRRSCQTKKKWIKYSAVKGRKPTRVELECFIDYWDIMIIASDFLLMFGCLIQFSLSMSKYSTQHTEFNVCSILLGFGVLLSTTSLISVLGILIDKCHIVMVALWEALKSIIPFLWCSSFVLLGFLLCGYLFLGPYVEKFGKITIALEGIFSLMNGDDVYATFTSLENAPSVVNGFGQLYMFLLLVVLIIILFSVVTSIITDEYAKAVKQYQRCKKFKTAIEKFLAEDTEFMLKKTKLGRLGKFYPPRLDIEVQVTRQSGNSKRRARQLRKRRIRAISKSLRVLQARLNLR